MPSASSASAAGRVTVTVVPAPSVDAISSVPPCSVTISSVTARPMPLPRCLDGLRDALAVVAHGCDDLASVPAQDDIDFLTVRSVFRSVVQNIEEYLLHAVAVAVDIVIGIHILVIAELDTAFVQQVFVHINRLIQLDRQVEQLDLQLHAARFDAGEIQQLLHHPGQAV